MNSTILPKVQFWDASVANDRKVFQVGGFQCVTVQINLTSTSAGNAPKFVIERSIDGLIWVAAVPSSKMDADTISGLIDTKATPYLSVRSDMTSGTVTSYLVDILVCGDGY
jgi:hypothetical protein